MAGVALITGAARGLGAATARALAHDGWQLVLTDTCVDDPVAPYPLATEEELDAVRRICAELGAEVVTATADVRDQDALDAAVALARETFGRLDAAVANAGVIAGGPPLWKTDEATWRLLLDVDLTGVWRLAVAAVPALLDSTAGRFVAVSSAAGTRPLPRLAAYSAAKHGVVGLVTSLAADLAGTGVTANVVAPGSMRTAMIDASAAVYDLEDAEVFTRHSAVGRLLDPDEVAAAVAWLCGPAASAVTGAVVPVDGGFRG